MATSEPASDLFAPTATGGHLIGYARTSRRNQILDRQIAALTAVGCKRIYRDQLSGKDAGYATGLKVDVISACGVALLGSIGGFFYALGTSGPHPLRNYVLLSLISTPLAAGLISHSVTSRRFRAALL